MTRDTKIIALTLTATLLTISTALVLSDGFAAVAAHDIITSPVTALLVAAVVAVVAAHLTGRITRRRSTSPASTLDRIAQIAGPHATRPAADPTDDLGHALDAIRDRDADALDAIIGRITRRAGIDPELVLSDRSIDLESEALDNVAMADPPTRDDLNVATQIARSTRDVDLAIAIMAIANRHRIIPATRHAIDAVLITA